MTELQQTTRATERSNEAWLSDLRVQGPQQDEALAELRSYLLRGLFAFLRENRSDLAKRDPDDLAQIVEDFTQEALLKILDSLETFRGESKFPTWAMKVAVRTALSALRRAAFKDLSLNDLQERGASLRIAEDTAVRPASSPDPQLEAERNELLGLLEEAVRTELSEKQRTAFLATNVDGVPIEVVARLMGSNNNALYKLVHDARLKLRAFLIERGFTFDRIAPMFEGT